jgi:translation elongation factor EF-1alpha
METNNVVIFGPAHSGKSTLAGYWNYLNMDEGERKKKILWFERNIPGYKPEQKFTYFFDTHQDELIRNKSDDQSTTKHTKVKYINVDGIEIGVIDTPGDENASRERIKGIFFGDIGIFVIEASDLPKIGEKLLKDDKTDYLRTYFAPLNIWLKFKEKENLVIVLSKMDVEDISFSEKKFHEAVEKLNWFVAQKFSEVIPLSIKSKEEISHNFETKSEKLLWYKGPTLSEKINSLVHRPHIDTEVDYPLFLYIDYQFNYTKGPGKILRGKVLQGTIKKNSKVTISSVKYSKKGMLINPTANIKNIKLAGTDEDINVATSGDIITIDISDIRINDSRIEKKYLDITRTTSIFGYSSSYLSGNILQFEMNSKDLARMQLAKQLNILWFGRKLSCNIVNKEIFEKKGTVTVLISNNLPASLPIDAKGNLFIDRFLLDDKTEDYYEAILKNIGFLKDVSLKFKYLSESDIKLLGTYFENYYISSESKTVEFSNVDLLTFIRKIKQVFYHKSFDCLDYEINIKLYNPI